MIFMYVMRVCLSYGNFSFIVKTKVKMEATLSIVVIV